MRSGVLKTDNFRKHFKINLFKNLFTICFTIDLLTCILKDMWESKNVLKFYIFCIILIYNQLMAQILRALTSGVCLAWRHRSASHPLLTNIYHNHLPCTVWVSSLIRSYGSPHRSTAYRDRQSKKLNTIEYLIQKE